MPVLVLSTCALFISPIQAQKNYLDYHWKIINAEILVTEHKYEDALVEFEKVFTSYDFIFLRDYKVASQIALFLGHKDKGLEYLRSGMARGWSTKEIMKNRILSDKIERQEWKKIVSEEDSLQQVYSKSLNQFLRSQVHEMFKKDQKKAIGALFRIGNKAQEKYSEQKFGPHSEVQMAEFDKILDEFGYPGEQLIGNEYWMATIVSHHNSISKEYVLKDTIFQYLRPALLNALKNGEISPFELALMEDWKTAVENDHNQTTYGFIGPIHSRDQVKQINLNRFNIGLRSLEIRNALADIQVETGLDFSLPGKPWQKDKIILE